MKVLVLTGSPHRKGTTALLADAFCEGAVSAGHTVTRFDTAHMKIHPCLGCLACKSGDRSCVQRDDMAQIYDPLLEADALVLVSPLYYLGMTAQLKTALDRLFSLDGLLRKQQKKVCLLSAAGKDYPWIMDGLTAHVNTICHYLGWELRGSVLAYGVPFPAALEGTAYLEQARALGTSL